MQENSPPAEEHTMSPCQRNFIQLDTFWCFLTKKSSPLLYQPEQQGVRIELLVCVCVCVRERENWIDLVTVCMG